MSETTLITGASISPFQAMFHELYSWIELNTYPAIGAYAGYTGASTKWTYDSSWNVTYAGGAVTFSGGLLTVSAGGVTVSGGDIRTTSTRNITVTGSGLLGYNTGSGGTVTQATSKSTAVTLSKSNGTITMNGAALAANTAVAFVVNNTAVSATDTIIVNIASGPASATSYQVHVGSVVLGAFSVVLRNTTGGSLSESPVLNFSVIKAVAA